MKTRVAAARAGTTWIEAAAALYIASVRARAPLDRVFAETLRGLRSLDDHARGQAVDIAQGMLRARRRVEAAARALPFEPTSLALVCLYAAGTRRVAAHALPIEPAEGQALVAAWDSTADAPLPVRASLPEFLVDRLLAERPLDGEALCMAFAQTPPTTLRVNTLRIGREALIDRLAGEGMAGTATHYAPTGITLIERTNVFRSAAFKDGLFEVQDEGSQLVALLCAAEPGMTVVDGCAGAGGKTLQLAAAMRGTGTLVALDVSHRRLDDLKERCRRAGVHNVRVHPLDDSKTKKRLAGRADVVLVDAPCSGTGVLRRNPDTAWRLAPVDIARMVDQQTHILASYLPLVKRGGRIVYATCSLLREENEAVVERVCALHPEFVPVAASDVLAAQQIAVPGTTTFLHTDPLRHGTDGFFGAVLQRPA